MENSTDYDMKLTVQDLEALRRCRSESFWYRCVPFTIGNLSGAFYLHSRGYFVTRSTKIGAIIFAIFTGYSCGKLSYIERCKQMFLELDDSRIKDSYLKSDRFSFKSYPTIMNNESDKKPEGVMSYAERREYYKNLNKNENSDSNYDQEILKHNQNDLMDAQKPEDDTLTNPFFSDDYPRSRYD